MPTENPKIAALLESHKRNVAACDAETAQICADLADMITRRGAVSSEQLDGYMVRLRRVEAAKQTSTVMVNTLDLVNKLA